MNLRMHHATLSHDIARVADGFNGLAVGGLVALDVVDRGLWRQEGELAGDDYQIVRRSSAMLIIAPGLWLVMPWSWSLVRSNNNKNIP